MLPCGHENAPYSVPICSHLRGCTQPGLSYVKWYVGTSLDTELLCLRCAEDKENGRSLDVARICKMCFERATDEIGDLVRVGGQPEILSSSSRMNTTIVQTTIQENGCTVVDIAPVGQETQSIWITLADDGSIYRLNADTGKSDLVARIKFQSESERTAFAGHSLKPRLHVSHNGEFAAVVNDYGQYGQVIDLRSGKVTLSLDGGAYHPETVPFSFAFTSHRGNVAIIHRTAWNRLDVSNAASGKLLSERNPTSYARGEKRPPHYLDYFHGALHLSPKGTRLLDDGWVWHPVGIPVVWTIDQWLSENVWESEDGVTRTDVCARNNYWDHGVAWLNEETVVIAGIGDDDNEMIDGARIFDVTSTGPAGVGWRSDWKCARQITAFAGPAGSFFSDGKWLYSSGKGGLSRWDIDRGSRTGHIDNFHPTHHHVGSGELAQFSNGAILRWMIERD